MGPKLIDNLGTLEPKSIYNLGTLGPLRLHPTSAREARKDKSRNRAPEGSTTPIRLHRALKGSFKGSV